MVEFIAEFTNYHMGNFHLLMNMLDYAKALDVDYVRIPRKNVDTFYSQEELVAPVPINCKLPYGLTYGEYRKVFEFTEDEFDKFDQRCNEYNLEWFSTPQDRESFEFLKKYKLNKWKVASCNCANIDYLKYVKSMTKEDDEIFISTGGARYEDIENIVSMFDDRKLCIMHCVSEYPTQQVNMKLGNITRLIDDFKSNNVRIGYSGHELGYQPTIAAIDLGAEVVERHFIIKKHDLFPRVNCALDVNEYAELIAISRSGKKLEEYYDLYEVAFREEFKLTKDVEHFFEDQSCDRK